MRFKPTLVLIAIPFGLLTLYAISQVGVIGLFTLNLSHAAGQQVFADLFIAIGLICVWIWRDARATGRNPWLWTSLSFCAGSFGPLLYLLTRRDLK